MSLSKEECENSLINLCSSNSKIKDRKVFKQLINEHFELVENFKQLEKNYDDLYDKVHNSKPLKFEELKEDMWVWDNTEKEYCYIYFIAGKYIHRAYLHNLISDGEFEEKRFYRRQVD